MNEREKSDSRIVPMKQPNKSNAKANEAEVVEGRGLTEGNPRGANVHRTQSREDGMLKWSCSRAKTARSSEKR
jgi:hypothetical protein